MKTFRRMVAPALMALLAMIALVVPLTAKASDDVATGIPESAEVIVAPDVPAGSILTLDPETGEFTDIIYP